MRDDLVLSRLRQTYDSLQARDMVASEAEILISALIEELEDVNDDVESTKRSQSTLIEGEGEDPEGILEAEVTDLLKRLLGAC